MQLSSNHHPRVNGFGRSLGYLLLAPLTLFTLASLALIIIITVYQNQHQDRIYTGVSVWGIDLSRMNQTEAETTLSSALPYTQQKAITLTDPKTGRRWERTPAELGLTYDVTETVIKAYETGRNGALPARLSGIFSTWYYGRTLNPIILLDEGRLDAALDAVAQEVYEPASNAILSVNGETADYTPGKTGRAVDFDYGRDRILESLISFRAAEVGLLVHDSRPVIFDDNANSNQNDNQNNNENSAHSDLRPPS